MIQAQTAQARSSSTRARIVQVAIRLYREIGYRKTTVADIARGASMSPANVYRFFPSRQAIEEAVVATLLEEASAAAGNAARSAGPARQRLGAALMAIAELNEHWRAHDSRLHELMAAAVRANWPAALSHAGMIRGLVGTIIEAGQASGELRPGSPTELAGCMLEAMDVYLSPSRINKASGKPAFDDMMNFCTNALRSAPSGQSMDKAIRPASHDQDASDSGGC